MLKYVCNLWKMTLPMFLLFHFRRAQVRVVAWGPKQPSNTDLCSLCRLNSHSWSFALPCNFQFSIALVMMHSSVRKDVLELLDKIDTCHSRDAVWSFLLYTAQLARQRNLPPFWFGIAVVLLQWAAVFTIFFHYLDPVKQDFKLPHY